MCAALGVSDQFPGGCNETDSSWFEWEVLAFSTEIHENRHFKERILYCTYIVYCIFHRVYIDEITCNNASVKLIYGHFLRESERRPVSGWETCNATVLSAFEELIKAPVGPSPYNHLVIRWFESHLRAVVARDILSQHKCDRRKCSSSLGQLMPDSVLSLAVSSRLIFH